MLKSLKRHYIKLLQLSIIIFKIPAKYSIKLVLSYFPTAGGKHLNEVYPSLSEQYSEYNSKRRGVLKLYEKSVGGGGPGECLKRPLIKGMAMELRCIYFLGH